MQKEGWTTEISMGANQQRKRQTSKSQGTRSVWVSGERVGYGGLNPPVAILYLEYRHSGLVEVAARI